MRFFSLMDFQHMVMAFFLGLVVLILLVMAWAGYRRTRRTPSEEELAEREGHEVRSGHNVERNPIVPFLIFVYVGIIIWAIAYVLIIGIFGGPIG